MKKIISIVLFISAMVFAQSDSSSLLNTVGNAVTSGVKISGEAGIYGELYTISGRDARRKPQTGRVFFRPTITLLDNFSISFDLFLSTEGNAARQQLSTISLHPEWGWSKWHIGDFTHELSKYTLSGLNIRGGGVELSPGVFRFHAVGGETQRATNNGAYASTYTRHLGAIKLGLAFENGSFIEINALKSKDDVTSLPKDLFISIDTVTGGGTTKIDTSFLGTPPQENIVSGLSWAVKLFSGAVSLKGEAAATIFTRDLYSKPIAENDLKDLPTVLSDVFTLRQSSNADFAYNADMAFTLNPVNGRFAYSFVGPGFTSLGLASVINDKKTFDGTLGLTILGGALSFQGNYQQQNDNLVNQKLYTTNRKTMGVTAGIRPASFITVSLGYTRNTLNNTSSNDTLKIDNLNTALTGNVLFVVKLFGVQTSLTVAYGVQTYTDKNVLRAGNDVNSSNANAALTIPLTPQWNISAGANMNTVEVQSKDKQQTSGINFRIGNKSLSNKLNSALSYSLSSSSSMNAHSLQLQSTYPITTNGSLQLGSRLNNYQQKTTAQKNFTEITTTLSYNYRF